MKTVRAAYVAAVVAALSISSPANATLVVGDFQSAGDHLLVTDTATNLQYLSPYATRDISPNAILGGFGNYLTTYGFHYADSATVRAMIKNNFDNPPPIPTAAGYTDAVNFFDVFGINDTPLCGRPDAVQLPCPRTLGYALDLSFTTDLGMIATAPDGYMFDGLVTPLFTGGDNHEVQLGSWLVRSLATTPGGGGEVPEPASIALLAAGLTGFAARRRSKRSKT